MEPTTIGLLARIGALAIFGLALLPSLMGAGGSPLLFGGLFVTVCIFMLQHGMYKPLEAAETALISLLIAAVLIASLPWLLSDRGALMALSDGETCPAGLNTFGRLYLPYLAGVAVGCGATALAAIRWAQRTTPKQGFRVNLKPAAGLIFLSLLLLVVTYLPVNRIDCEATIRSVTMILPFTTAFTCLITSGLTAMMLYRYRQQQRHDLPDQP